MGKFSIFKTMSRLVNYSNIIAMQRERISILPHYST